jgi:hypothetical protein
MPYKVNPFTSNLDDIGNLNQATADARYLKLNTSNDPLTGELVITPASGTTALRSNADIVIKSGKKLVFDGA